MLNKKIKIEKNNIMHFCFSCISYLSFGTEIAGETVLDLTNNNALDRFIGYIGYWRKCQIYRKQVYSESFINMSLQLYNHNWINIHTS